MEFKKCGRCGNFYVSDGLVCPKCTPKDDFEFSTFQSYVAENGENQSTYAISGATGISVKNLNRFLKYNNNNNENIAGNNYGENNLQTNNESNSELNLNNNENNDGITFLI